MLKPIRRRVLVALAALLPLLAVGRVRASPARPAASVDPVRAGRVRWWSEAELLEACPALPDEAALLPWQGRRRHRSYSGRSLHEA